MPLVACSTTRTPALCPRKQARRPGTSIPTSLTEDAANCNDGSGQQKIMQRLGEKIPSWSGPSLVASWMLWMTHYAIWILISAITDCVPVCEAPSAEATITPVGVADLLTFYSAPDGDAALTDRPASSDGRTTHLPPEYKHYIHIFHSPILHGGRAATRHLSYRVGSDRRCRHPR